MNGRRSKLSSEALVAERRLKLTNAKKSRPGLTFESKGFLENEAHSHRLGNFTPKLDNLPTNSPRTFHGLLRKRMKAKTD